MKIKSLEEIKGIIEKFPEASKVEYVIAPQLIKIALQVGLIGYEKALEAWLRGRVFDEKVFNKVDQVEIGKEGEKSFTPKLFINYKGVGLRLIGGVPAVGIKRTIEDIEEILKESDVVEKKEPYPSDAFDKATIEKAIGNIRKHLNITM